MQKAPEMFLVLFGLYFVCLPYCLKPYLFCFGQALHFYVDSRRRRVCKIFGAALNIDCLNIDNAFGGESLKALGSD